MEGDPTSRETFLLEEGLAMLAHYRAINDPQLRLAVRQLVAVIAEGQTRER